jgi:hypothetical protein
VSVLLDLVELVVHLQVAAAAPVSYPTAPAYAVAPQQAAVPATNGGYPEPLGHLVSTLEDDLVKKVSNAFEQAHEPLRMASTRAQIIDDSLETRLRSLVSRVYLVCHLS